MIIEKIDLYDYFKIPRNGNEQGYLTAYNLGVSWEINKERKYPAILIIPGGGYEMVSDREGEPVALEFLNNNYNAFILNYSVKPLCYPTQLLEASMAMIYIKENAYKYNIDKKNVAAIGFSAGGHLCGCLATIFDDENIVKNFGEERAELVKPTAVILSYAVLSSENTIWHEGSFVNVSNNNKELINYLSLEKQVNKNSSPAFIWHTMEDTCVPVENSLLYAKKCKEEGVPFELHIFEKGGHGLSVCNQKSDGIDIVDEVRQNVGEWVKLSINWLRLNCIKLVK
jgi:acetyl esterase/lipase